MGIFNCDWFSFTADFEKYNVVDLADRKDLYDPEVNKHLSRLFAQLDEERSKEDGRGFIDLGMWKFEVLNHGSRSYYYLLHNDDMEIRLAKYRSRKEENFPVFVHFKSQFLWSDIYGLSTLEDKFRLVIEWLQDVFNGKYITSKINRIDLCYHTDDIPLGFNAEHFVGRHTLDTTRRTHRVISGIDIGSRRSNKLFLRCYNKFLEARATKKEWFFKIWEHAGLNIRKVWNIEFQVDREFFSEFKVGRKRLDTAEEIIARMPTIWHYLTNDWITYRIPDNERRTRWSLHPWWESLLEFAEATEKISRGKQRELPTATVLIPAIRGYLSSYAARMGGDINDGSLFQEVFKQICDYEDVTGRKFEEDVDVKRSLMDPEDNITEIEQISNEISQVRDKVFEMYRQGRIKEKPHISASLEDYQRLLDEGIQFDMLKSAQAATLPGTTKQAGKGSRNKKEPVAADS